MSQQMSKTRAALELLVAANFWGFGFVATIWALNATGPLWLTALRFGIASVISLPVILYFPKLRAQLGKAVMVTFLPGLCLTLTLIFQTWGLRFTTATKSGFITCLYVVMVPVIEWLWFKQELSKIRWFSIALALLGTGLIADLRTFQEVNKGDFLTFLCAIAAAFHIIFVGRSSQKVASPFVFNSLQSAWAGILPFFLAIPIEVFPVANWSLQAIAGMALLIFGSTMFAFLLQVRAQRVLDATSASMMFLLESPLAAIYAFWVLSETSGPNQWLGGTIISIAAFLCIWNGGRRPRHAA